MLKISRLFIYLTTSLSLASNVFALDTIAQQAILQDFDTKAVIFEKNADIRVAPSSMSKLMTTYIVFERLKKGELNFEHKFNISEKAWKMQGSKMFLHVGDQVDIDNLLKGVIIQSGNDACIAIAEGISGSEEIFAELMNQKAKELGLNNSHFVNSTGWPDENHLMTMRDLAILSDALIRDFPEYYNYFSMKEFLYSGIKQQNRNSLLAMNSGIDGLKTGHTEMGGFGIAASAKQNNRRMIVVVNGLTNHTDRVNEAYKLLQYGFLNYDNVKLFDKGQVVKKLPIDNAIIDEVEVITDNDIIFTIPKAKISQITQEVTYEPISAPIVKGQKIATLAIVLPDQLVKKEFDLLAKNEIESINWWQKIIKRVKNIF